MRVGVVGAGIVGLCCAQALHQRGFEVVVFDEGPIPSPRAASNDRRRLLRHAYPFQPDLVHRVDDALSAWRRLWRVLGEDYYRSTGVLALVRDSEDFAALSQRAYDRAGIDYRELTPTQLVSEFPFVCSEGVVRGIHCDKGGVLRADRILSALTDYLGDAGVQLEPGMAAQSVDLARAQVALESGEVFEADRLIVATGAWTPALIDDPKPARSQRQVVVHAVAPDEQSRQWQQAPAIVDFGGGSDAYIVPPAGDSSLTLGLETVGREAPINASRIPHSNEGAALLQRFKPFINNIDRYRVERTRVCFYAVTDDGLWRLRTDQRGLALSGCNGHMFKFGALIGELLADWVGGRSDANELRRILPAA